ncbi:MAG: carbohydrate kinase family protein [Pseudomonadales bacterium]|nr:carbohydrate kinase family protein [Pseudomonadales bacterium]
MDSSTISPANAMVRRDGKDGKGAPGPVLVCGSIAIDLIGRYKGSFAEYQARYPVSNLNISLQLASFHTGFGGCGMNIVYGLHCLGVEAVPLSSAGLDFDDQYRSHLEAQGICTSYINIDPDYPKCASAMLISDQEGNQITAFHAGASVSTHRADPADIAGIETFSVAVLAPEDATIMLRQGRSLQELRVPIVLDPGQGLAEFSRQELLELISLSDYLLVNEHEWEITQRIAGISAAVLTTKFKQVIVTHGERGSSVYLTQGDIIDTAAVPCPAPVDPTGCGDAFRAGYVAGLIRSLAPQTCARLGATLASINLASPDTQTYQVNGANFSALYEATYGEPVPPAIMRQLA